MVGFGVSVNVSITCRGLGLGERPLDVQSADRAFIACPDPMPVGSALRLEHNGTSLDALVTGVTETIVGRDSKPGMLVRRLSTARVAWWPRAEPAAGESADSLPKSSDQPVPTTKRKRRKRAG